MKLTTITIPAIELTREEELTLHEEYFGNKNYPNHLIIDTWLTDDGHNEILLNGETIFRVIIRPCE